MIYKLSQLKSKKSVVLLCLLFLFVIFALIIYKKTPIDCVPKHLHIYLQVEEQFLANNTDLKLDTLLSKLEYWNEQREVKNWAKFGPVEPDTPIVVVRVRTDLERLQYLVASLAQVTDIQRVLLVFSHSFYDENINHLIQKINFCMVLQIFYPNSVQLRRDTSSKGCTNRSLDANIPCMERDARLTESKHHWWWTANFVFDQLAWAETHKDMVIFIDEDSYVLPDFLFMLTLSKYSLASISDASVLSFGRSPANDLQYNKLIVEAWRPPYDKGLAFNRTTWRRIASLGSFYCQYDDTSWSYSLMHLFEQFPRGCVVMVASMAPRVISTGVLRCGRHALENICGMIKEDQLFPRKVQAVILFGHGGRLLRDLKPPPHGNGGWSDQRDHQLCSHPLISTSFGMSTTIRPDSMNEP